MQIIQQKKLLLRFEVKKASFRVMSLYVFVLKSKQNSKLRNSKV